MKIIPIIYTVRGTGPFPIDMLREDGSCPYSQRDSERIEMAVAVGSKLKAILQITLIKHNGYHNWKPNNEWESFGWDVIIVEEKRT